MSEWAAARKCNAEAIWVACREFSALRVPQFKCASCPGSCHSAGANCEHAHYKCYVYLQPERLADGWSRDRIVETITAEGVPCYQGSCSEVYLEKAFDDTGWRPEARLPVAKELGETALMFLVHPTLTFEEISKTCVAIQRVMKLACC